MAKKKEERQKIEEKLLKNDWNPFERVDPIILERLNKKYEAGRKVYLLETQEKALL